MSTVSTRFGLVRFLWIVGAVALFCLTLVLALVGAAAYILIAAAGWLLGFDPLPWFLLSALVWAPAATGFALSAMSSQVMVVCLNYARPPEVVDQPIGSTSAAAWQMGEHPKNLGTTLAVAMVIGGILAANLAPIVLLIEFIEWLTSSEWPGLTVADGLALFGIVHEQPESESQRLIDLVLAVPLSISLFAVGILLCVAGLNLGDRSIQQTAANRW